MFSGSSRHVGSAAANRCRLSSVAGGFVRTLLVTLAAYGTFGCNALSESTKVHVLPPDTAPAAVGQTCDQNSVGSCSAEESLGSANDSVMRDAYKDEWSLNKHPGEPPSYCIAMSGGGTRSAAFNLGVLSGLNELPAQGSPGVLDQVDVISAVSGGSYIASWYYLQHETKDPGETEPAFRSRLFNPDSDYQAHLLNHSALLPPDWVFFAGLFDVVTIPGNLFANWLFGWHFNTSPGAAFYRERINWAFHQSPDGKSLDMSFPELLDLVKTQHLPMPIFNAAALIEDDPYHRSSKMGNSDFEFTPFGYGSDAFGTFRYKDERDLDLAHVVAVSGAAVDSAELVAGPSQALLAAAFNFDWGRYISNPSVHQSTRNIHYIIPFPFYYLHHYIRDQNGVAIYLADGGFADNLGAFPLIRRLCSNIVIVDGEADPEYTFDSYFKLQDAVQGELGAHLSVPDIDQCDGGLTCTTAADRFDKVKAVMRGSVSFFPWGPKGERKGLNIVYIKLWASDPDEKKDPYPPSVAKAWEGSKSKRECGPLPATNGCFPQDPTTKQDFDADKFAAYRDLGRVIVTSNRAEILSALGPGGSTSLPSKPPPCTWVRAHQHSPGESPPRCR